MQTTARTALRKRSRTGQMTAINVLPPDDGLSRPAPDLRLDGLAQTGSRNRHTDGAAQADQAVILAPLTEAEATSDLFKQRPRLNELLSVMKLTWKLARRKKQEKD